jgi:hypothetical protein
MKTSRQNFFLRQTWWWKNSHMHVKYRLTIIALCCEYIKLYILKSVTGCIQTHYIVSCTGSMMWISGSKWTHFHCDALYKLQLHLKSLFLLTSIELFKPCEVIDLRFPAFTDIVAKKWTRKKVNRKLTWNFFFAGLDVTGEGDRERK